MSDLQTAAASLISSVGVQSHLGDEITISHGGYTSTAITAEFCHESQPVDEQTGMLLEMKLATFKLAAADLVINGNTIKPMPGMRIAKGSETWEVQPPPGNQQCFAPMLGGLRWLIYAVQIG